MGKPQPPYLTAMLGISLLLAGCSSATIAPCEASMGSQRCHVERLLYRNDMLQAKMLIASGDPGNYELAGALLDRAQPFDERGEVSFYKALLKIKEGPQVSEVLPLLEHAADAGQPYAVALLYKVWSEPYLVAQANPGTHTMNAAVTPLRRPAKPSRPAHSQASVPMAKASGHDAAWQEF